MNKCWVKHIQDFYRKKVKLRNRLRIIIVQSGQTLIHLSKNKRCWLILILNSYNISIKFTIQHKNCNKTTSIRKKWIQINISMILRNKKTRRSKSEKIMEIYIETLVKTDLLKNATILKISFKWKNYIKRPN